ncbi:MAG: hypothetical protein QG635_1087 [Bacteroidota bacterium]|nr:hypothetical protein [Bacteroidota bacterium]
MKKRNRDIDNAGIENKPLGEEDYAEDEDAIEKTQNFIQKYRNYIIGASAVIILVISGFFYFRSVNEANEKKAAIALSRIKPYLKSSNTELALKSSPQLKVRGQSVLGLEQIISEYKGTAAGKLAALYAGNIYLLDNKNKEAERCFEIAADANSNLIICGADAGLAAVKENAGQFKEAAQLYGDAASLTEDEFIKYKYLYYSGLCYEKSGEKEKAERSYKTIINENQYSEFATHAKSGLTRLGIEIE